MSYVFVNVNPCYETCFAYAMQCSQNPAVLESTLGSHLDRLQLKNTNARKQCGKMGEL